MIKKEEMLDIFKNSLPKTTVELIGSNIYKPEIPKMIKVSPLSLQDEKQILTQDYGNDYYKIILNIVEHGIVTPININDLYLFDIDYLFNIIRIQTHGSTVPIEYTCPHCKTKNSFSFDLSAADINKPTKIQDITQKYKIKDIDIEFSIPTVKVRNNVMRYIHNKEFKDKIKKLATETKLIHPDAIDDSILSDLSIIFSYISKLNNETIETDEDYVYAIFLILSLTREDLLLIRNKINKITKIFNIEHTYKCKKCSKDITISLSDLGSEYFFPTIVS